MLWEDNFSADSLNSKYWNALSDNSGGGNDELQFYTPRDTNVYIEKGKLILKALKEEYQGFKYTSGKITSLGNADWRYGRFEAKIKLPEGQGIWPAFWMLPTVNKYGGWPNSGEIDIMELIGQEPSTVYGTLHYGPPWNYSNGEYKLEEGKFSDTAHVFAFEWTADTMQWFVDDELYSVKTKDDLSRPEQWDIFHERFYMILNLAVGGNWPGDPDETTSFPQTMEIDYVRVYGDPGLQEIIAIDSAYARSTAVQYSFIDIPGAEFHWSVPEGAEIISGQGSSKISVNWGCTGGDISLNLSSIGCNDQEYILPVEFSEYKISGPEITFPLEELSFTVPSLSGTSYQWSFPSDASLNGNSDDSLDIIWGCDEDYLIITAENDCAIYTDSLYISIMEPGISGPSTVSELSMNVLYYTDPVPASSFLWTVPEDADIASGEDNDSVRVNFGLTGGNVSVEITNSCYTRILDLPVRITDTVLLADFESVSPEFLTFSNTSFEIVENPAPDEVNTSQNVGKSLKSEVPWAGIYTDLGYNLNLEKHKNFSLKVLGPKKGSVLLKLEDIDIGTVSPVEFPSEYENAGQWQLLEWSFPDAPTDVYDRITLFFDFGSDVENYYYFDDLNLLPTDNTFAEQAEIEEFLEFYPNPFHSNLSLRWKGKLQGKIDIFSIDGRLEKTLAISGERITADLSFLKNGIYIIRVGDNEKIISGIIVKQ